MRSKRVLSLLLSCALLVGMLVLPTAAAGGATTAFTDIYDADVAQAAETLRLLGIVNGTGGSSFTPGRTLTRAEFCKMAVELMGNGDKVAAQMNRTIFKDVPSNHWARGYIAVATQATTQGSGESAAAAPGIIRGDAYGNFSPDRAITYAEAITILVRILGYGDGDVGMVWPNGYLAKAAEIKLSDGVALSAWDDITRGQAAVLMENLLFTDGKASGEEYLNTLGCTITEETILFDVAAVAPDGSKGVKASENKIYKTDHAPFSTDLVGGRAKLVLDKNDKIVAVQPSTNGTQKVVGILSLAYNSMKVSGGTEVKIDKPTETLVWQDGESSTFEKVYLKGLAAGTQAVLQYSASGELEYIFVRTGKGTTDGSTTVVKNSPSYSGNEGYTVYKNGVLATTSDIRQYDVTTFDQTNDVMYVSDLRITGTYENAYPNRETPATITVMGHAFPVLASAAGDLRSFDIGDKVTLLFSSAGQVAGAVGTTVAKSTTVGTVDTIDRETGLVTVTALMLKDEFGQSLTLKGTTGYRGANADAMEGQLVTVNSGQKDRLTLSRLSGSGAKAPLDVKNGTIGTMKLSDNVKLYEQVGNSKLKAIELDDITITAVPAKQISYVRTDYAGNAEIVVLQNVTGDCYSYGFIKYKPGKINEGMEENIPTTIAVESMEDPEGTSSLTVNIAVEPGKMGGIVAVAGGSKLASYVALKSKDNVRSGDFDVENMILTTNTMVIPVADNVQCYNASTKSWFAVGENASDEDYQDALNLARAFSDEMTIYYDRDPGEGGKVRLVVVE